MSFDPTGVAEAVFNAMLQIGTTPVGYAGPTTESTFANVQYAYGAYIGAADPGLYAYEALGASLAGMIVPVEIPPTVSDQQFLEISYRKVFGQLQQPNNLRLEALQSQLTFLENLYEHAGFQPNPDWPGWTCTSWSPAARCLG